MVSDFSNRKDIRRAEKAAKLAEANRIAYIKRIMSDTAGREWLHTHLNSCYVFGEAFVRSAPDATAWNLGRQSVGKQLFADVITHCPTQYVQMMQEAAQKDMVHDSGDKTVQEPEVGEEEPSKVETEYDPI